MNLDNYFARYLHKGGSRKACGSDAVISGVSPDQVTVIHPVAVTTPEEAAQSQSSPTAAEPTQHTDGTEATGHTLKRAREGAEEINGTHSPVSTMARRRCFGNDDDDDDELDVLLGKDKAQDVKELNTRQKDTGGAVASLTTTPDTSTRASGVTTAVSGAGQGNAEDSYADSTTITVCSEGDGDDGTVSSGEAAVQSISSLEWNTCSSRVLDSIAMHFVDQFEYSLRSNAALYNRFEPFFRDKVLHRIDKRRGLSRVLPPAPTVTQSSTGALPGCVLRDYQVAGVQFLLDNFHCGQSCILSDDMGLGKTAQVSSFLHVLKLLHGISGPHLIVAPLSTLTSWTRELARWAPQLRAVKYHGERHSRQTARHDRRNRHAVIVTTPSVLNQDKTFFRKRSWVTVIVDEAHVLKGSNTQITRIARKLGACFRVAVTGTPVHNNVREVWNLMSFLYPSHTAGFDTNGDDGQAAKDCASLLQHIMLRRTKESMELGIPPRVDEPVAMLEPTYIQLELLSALTTQALQGADDGGGARRMIGHLSHQRAVCNHPMALRLLSLEDRMSTALTLTDRFAAAGVPIDEKHLIAPSAKMVYLDGLLAQLKREGHRCLIFSNFTTTLDLLEAMCALRGHSYERLDGTCNRVERELSILRYNAPNSSCFLFLITTTAGGVGVTLTGADTVIMFDAHFNPQLDRQAADRAHRIGQTRTVHVHRLCLASTVEEHIREIADRKASLGDLIVDGGSRKGGDDGITKLTADDIREIMRHFEADRERQRQRGAVARAADASSSGCQDTRAMRPEEDEMVRQLARLERGGSMADQQQPRQATERDGGLGRLVCTTNHCFVCGDLMHPLEPLYHCIMCPKAYHAQCIGERVPKPGEATPRLWTCPRHTCSQCEKTQVADGAIFMCSTCPRSFCFDCLDPRYLVLKDDGTALQHISRTYAEMAAEDFVERRSCYYVSCLYCCGVLSSSSSSSGSSSDGDGSDASDCQDDGYDDDVEAVE